jgi:putative ATPase
VFFWGLFFSFPLRVFTLSKLTPLELEQILQNALSSLPSPLPRLPNNLIPFLADVADGDARQALNSLELSLTVCERRDHERLKMNDLKDGKVENGNTNKAATKVEDDKKSSMEDVELMEAIKRGLRKGYDRTGEERYDMISALHKSIRGSDGSAALYWLARYVGRLAACLGIL